MATLSEVAPAFVTEVQRALRAEGRDDLADAVPAAPIADWEWDESVGMGYIRFARAHGESVGRGGDVAETIPSAGPYWFHVDVGRDGTLFGIEVDSRHDVHRSFQLWFAP